MIFYENMKKIISSSSGHCINRYKLSPTISFAISYKIAIKHKQPSHLHSLIRRLLYKLSNLGLFHVRSLFTYYALESRMKLCF